MLDQEDILEINDRLTAENAALKGKLALAEAKATPAHKATTTTAPAVDASKLHGQDRVAAGFANELARKAAKITK